MLILSSPISTEKINSKEKINSSEKLKKNIYRSLSKNNLSNIISAKSNYISTIKKFYNEDAEIVKKLDYFIAPSTSSNTKEISLFDLKISQRDLISKRKDVDEDLKNFSADDKKFNTEVFPPLESPNNKILERKAYLKRIENIANEAKLETQLKTIRDKLGKLKIEKQIAVNKMLNLQRDISENLVSIEFLKNYEKYIELSSNTVNSKKLENMKQISKKHAKEDGDVINAKTTTLRDAAKRMADIKNLEAENERKSQEKIFLVEEINTKENKIIEKNEIFDNIRNKLMLHYHQLLNEGTDTRHDGLVWIIRAIWNLGCNVIISYLPNFLDEKVIKYLFETSHKEAELQKLKNLIEETKSKMKTILRAGKFNKKRKNNLFKTDLSQSSAKNTAEKFIRFKEKKDLDDKFNIKKIEDYLSKKDRLDEESLIILKNISDLEKEYDLFKQELKDMKHLELNRLCKEFLVNDYARRFNIDQATLVSVIAGEDNTTKELIRQTRLQRDHYEKKRQCEYFNYIQEYANSRKVPNIIAISRKL